MAAFKWCRPKILHHPPPTAQDASYPSLAKIHLEIASGVHSIRSPPSAIPGSSRYSPSEVPSLALPFSCLFPSTCRTANHVFLNFSPLSSVSATSLSASALLPQILRPDWSMASKCTISCPHHTSNFTRDQVLQLCVIKHEIPTTTTITR